MLWSEEVVAQCKRSGPPWYVSVNFATTLSRKQVGTDEHAPYKRLVGKHCQALVIEFGEPLFEKQVIQKQNRRKASLISWIEATCGMTWHSNEHAEDGPAIRVRTVKRRPVDDKCQIHSEVSKP